MLVRLLQYRRHYCQDSQETFIGIPTVKNKSNVEPRLVAYLRVVGRACLTDFKKPTY